MSGFVEGLKTYRGRNVSLCGGGHSAGGEGGPPRRAYEPERDAAVLGDGAFKATWSPESERVVVSAPDVQGLFVWRDPGGRRGAGGAGERGRRGPPGGGG